MKTFSLSLLAIITISIWSTCGIKAIRFKQNCGGHLKRAADANTVDIAKSELKIALDYMEANNLTSGYTSVIYETPDEDVAFWYNNIKQSYNELNSLPDSSSSLEKSNMLIKLRETLLDHGDKSDTVTMPDGISRYPDNVLYFFLGIVSIVCFLGIMVLLFLILED